MTIRSHYGEQRSVPLLRPNPYRGAFIVMEGIDGSAKTTQSERLVAKLRDDGYDAMWTHEPWFGEHNDDVVRLRRSLMGEETMSPVAHQQLHVRLRELHLTKCIIPALEHRERAVVVSDRYFPSTVAYGAASAAMSFNDVAELHAREAPHAFFPDCTIILDVPVGEALRRLAKSRETASFFERREMLERVRRAYREFAAMFSDDRVHLVPGEGTEDEVFARIEPLVRDAIEQKFGKGERV